MYVKFSFLKNTLMNIYGVGVLAADPLTIEWAATKMVEGGHAPEKVRKEVTAINDYRARYGKGRCYLPYGHPAF